MRRTSMKKVREIVRLHKECGLSQRKIARVLNISRPTVSDYMAKIQSAGLGYNDIRGMSDDALLEILNGNRRNDSTRLDVLQGKFKKYSKELKRVGVTREILWEEYMQENPGGYRYSQFCYHFHVWKKLSEVTMHMEHKAGDKLFVDFTGKKLAITDRRTGEQREVEVFVGVLGASHLTYVEAVMSQRKEDWIRANENALRYIGGVPRAIVPDCLKSAVTKGNKYEPEINPEYLDFARHYGTTILPARPYKPKDKAMVEGAVKIVYSWIFARIRDEVFFTLEDLNAAIREKLKEYNAKPMQKLDISWTDLFNEVERSEMGLLPAAYYELKRFKRLTVQFNYHVYLHDDRHYYSVPYRYRGQKVDLLYTESVVEVYHNNIRLAFYKRDRRKNGYTTTPEHMPPKHRYMDDWNPEKITDWASRKGEDVKILVERVLILKQHPEQSYKTCLGILSLAKKYGDIRLNNACRRALYYDSCSCRMIKNILENGLEDMREEQDLFNHTLPQHENIRGHNYYNQEEL